MMQTLNGRSGGATLHKRRSRRARGSSNLVLEQRGRALQRCQQDFPSRLLNNALKPNDARHCEARRTLNVAHPLCRPPPHIRSKHCYGSQRCIAGGGGGGQTLHAVDFAVVVVQNKPSRTVRHSLRRRCESFSIKNLNRSRHSYSYSAELKVMVEVRHSWNFTLVRSARTCK